MNAKELQKLPVKELQEKLVELQNQLIKERAQAARGTQNKNPHISKNIRKNIARILTILATKSNHGSKSDLSNKKVKEEAQKDE
jgi:ribosomal protein L29